MRASHLLLLVPFLALGTPWFNAVEPRLFGVPFFYWAQFAWIPVTVVCLAAVHLRTRHRPDASSDGHRPFTAP
ncbi:DUF3311 domain-containing protein [Pseudonocardia zijingensis]|uniref:DUF3311 domain-containing protein n=1 Tax=Pseudonocardia zijingensis TaxID=153376 RepID=A0ABP4AXL7_9PSEU